MNRIAHERGITIDFGCNFSVYITDGRLTTIFSGFCKILPQILRDFIQKVLIGFGGYAMNLKKKPFCCDRCGNDEEFIWKTRHGRETKILTIFQWVTLHQMQVQCKKCSHKFNITRKLLGIEPMKRIPADTSRKLGLIGSLMTYRVAEKIIRIFGWAVDKMTVWKSVQKTAEEIDFKLDPKEEPIGEADGTGIPIKGIRKIGKELKLFIQYKRGGGVRVAGLYIGSYNGDWQRLFKGSIEVLKGFMRFFLFRESEKQS